MGIIEICIPFVVAILGIAYPILLQVISKLDEKYNSSKIVFLFKIELEYKLFKWALYITLFMIFLYLVSLIIIPNEMIVWFEQIKIIIFFLTSYLIFFFFQFIYKILIYYDLYGLVKYFIHRDKKSNVIEDEYMYFVVLGELLQWAIKNQNEKIAKTISDHFYTCFQNYRDTSYNSDEGYPLQYYESVFKTVQELLLHKDNRLKFIEIRSAGGIWLLGEFSEITISEKTYMYLWQILKLVIRYKRNDLVLEYWQQAFQYFNYSLKQIERHSNLQIINSVDIKKREKERARFLEFHYALGGLLLFQQRYDCIYRMFRFTQSEPPEYVLFPQTMTEIFNQYFKFDNEWDDDLGWISSKYGFPNMEGLGLDSDGIIRNWICKYIAVLFLRQYTLIQYYTFHNHVIIPEIPKSQREINFWLERISFFKEQVLAIRSDEKMMVELGFGVYDILSDEWCLKNKKMNPTEFFDKTEQKIRDNFEQQKAEQKPTEEKIKEFYKSTDTIVRNMFNQYKNLTSVQMEKDYHSWYSREIKTLLLDKAAFCDNQEISYSDYDSILADMYVRNLNYTITQQFYNKITQKYLLESENIFKGIDNLKIKKPNDYVIITFSVFLPFYKNVEGLDLENQKYKEIDIYEIKGEIPHSLLQSFLIVKKIDLPYFNYREVSSEKQKNYGLKLIDKELKLYATIIDLNTRHDLHEENRGIKQGVDLNTQVFAMIEMNIEFRWKNNIEIVQIKIHSLYEENGIPNDLKDIKPFRKKKGV